MFPYETRVFVRPVSPQVRVQRAEGMYGQFLPSEGQEVLWDSFLHKRLLEGAITVEPVPADSSPRAFPSYPDLPLSYSPPNGNIYLSREGAITVEPIEPVRVEPEADQTEKEPS